MSTDTPITDGLPAGLPLGTVYMLRFGGGTAEYEFVSAESYRQLKRELSALSASRASVPVTSDMMNVGADELREAFTHAQQRAQLPVCCKARIRGNDRSRPKPAGERVGVPVEQENPVVGHKTMSDGSHIPLRQDEADSLLARIDAAQKRRETAMPDEQSAIRHMWDGWYRLKDFGWNDATYCPKDGSEFDAIEAGSTGIHKCSYQGEWPKGHWWIHADGDLWPSLPILFRLAQSTAEPTAQAPISPIWYDCARSACQSAMQCRSPESCASSQVPQPAEVARAELPEACYTHRLSSRICERGTKGCIVEHNRFSAAANKKPPEGGV